MKTDATDSAPDEPQEDADTGRTHSNDSLLAYIKGDQAKPVEDETTSDAEQAAETTPPTSDETAAAEVDVDTDVDGDPVVEDAPAEHAADEPAAPWYGAADLDFAKDYGLTAYDLATFADRDELFKTARFLDRYKANQPAPTEAKQAAAEEPVVDGPFNKDGTVNIEWYRKGEYDEGQIALAEALHKQQTEAAQLKQHSTWMEQQYAAQQAEAFNRTFHDGIESLARPDFYGKSVDAAGRPQLVSDLHATRRQQLADAFAVIAETHDRTKRPLPSVDKIIRQAESIVFSDEIAAADAKKAEADGRKKLEAIARQSTRRRPVSQAAGAVAKPTDKFDPNSSEAILAQPDFRKWRQEKAEEYGESLS